MYTISNPSNSLSFDLAIHQPNSSFKSLLKQILPFLHPVKKAILTKTQHDYFYDGLSFNFFQNIRTIPAPISQLDVCWKFATKNLPLYHKEKLTKPLLESSTHIFFQHPLILKIFNSIKPVLQLNIMWTRKSVLSELSNSKPSSFKIILLPLMLTAWFLRNHTKHRFCPEKTVWRQFGLQLKQTLIQSQSYYEFPIKSLKELKKFVPDLYSNLLT